MSDEHGGQEAARPPIPFAFQVDFGDGVKHGFSEMSGLDGAVAPIEYRTSDSKGFSAVKMPGIRKSSNVTLKRGVIARNTTFWAWLDASLGSLIERRTITIALLDEQARPVMVWKLTNAAPIKVEGPSLNANGNDVAVETVELSHEGVSIVPT